MTTLSDHGQKWGSSTVEVDVCSKPYVFVNIKKPYLKYQVEAYALKKKFKR